MWQFKHKLEYNSHIEVKSVRWKYLTNGAWDVSLKAEVGSFFLLLIGKNSIITCQHIINQLVWKKTRLLHLSFALYSSFREWSPYLTLFGQLKLLSASLFLLAAPQRKMCLYFPSASEIRYNDGQPRVKSCSSSFSNNCKHDKSIKKGWPKYQDSYLKERATTNKKHTSQSEGGATEQKQGGVGAAELLL